MAGSALGWPPARRFEPQCGGVAGESGLRGFAVRAGGGARRPVVVWWSFYFNRAADAFFVAVLRHFNIPLTEEGGPLSTERRAAKLTDLLRTGIGGRPLLLVLDGFETMQDHTAGREGLVADAACLPLFFDRNYLLVKPYLKGYRISPLGYHLLKDVSLSASSSESLPA